MKKTRKSIVVLLILVMAALSACEKTPQKMTEKSTDSAADNTATVADSTAGKEIEISFTWWGDTKRNEIYNAVCDDFEKNNPSIKVIREPASFNEYWDKLSTRIAGDNAPDVMGIHANFGSDLAKRGILADLQPYIDNGIFDTANIPSDLINSSRIGDKLCILPQGVTIECMYVNVSLLKEAGVDLGMDFAGGDATFTYDSFMAAAAKFMEAAKAKGMTDVYFGAPGGIENIAALQYWSRTNQTGVDLYKDEGGLGLTKENLTKWFEFQKELIDKGYAPDAATALENASAPLEDQLFTKDKMVIGTTSANQYSQYKAQMQDKDIYLIPFPVAEDGTNYNALVASHFAISNQSDDAHKEAAAKFLNYFYNSESAVKLFLLEQGVPINTKNAEAIIPLLDENSAVVVNFVNNWTAKGARFYVYPPAGSNEFAQLLLNASQTVTYGQASPSEAAEQLYKDAGESFAKLPEQ